MKRLLITSLFIPLFFYVNAQDLIVTTNEDSLNCQIKTITIDSLFFSFTNSDGVVFNTYMPQDQIKTYKRKFYARDGTSVRQLVAMKDLKNLWISVNGGLGYRFGEIDTRLSPEMHEYVEGLLVGPVFGIDAALFLGYSSGIGLKYSRFISSNSMYNSVITNAEGYTFHGDLVDNIIIRYLGASYAARLLSLNTKHAFTGSFGMGYMGYNDEGELGDDFIINGKSMGVSMDIGYAFTVAENLAIGFQYTCLYGILKKFEAEYRGQNETVELDEDHYESLVRGEILVRMIIKL
ncbi:MAG: hypothetical protein V2B15_14275 [Bacteroidota bacterium]